jgi:hypothetical protein
MFWTYDDRETSSTKERNRQEWRKKRWECKKQRLEREKIRDEQ